MGDHIVGQRLEPAPLACGRLVGVAVAAPIGRDDPGIGESDVLLRQRFDRSGPATDLPASLAILSDMLRVQPTPAWCATHPGACIGLLEISGIDNRVAAPSLEARKREVQQVLRSTYGPFERAQLAALPVLAAYIAYYRRFDKTYHVLLQLESVARKGKSFPAGSPLVDADFIAELQTLVLTAGHDAAKLQTPLSIDVSHDGDIKGR
jgi:hypothetical protein